MGDVSRHAGMSLDRFHGVHGGNSIGERSQIGRMLIKFCGAKHLCIDKILIRKDDTKKITNGS